jgi:hypothetical protein
MTNTSQWPRCANCGEPLAASDHVTATVVRDPDGQIRTSQATFYHTDCWKPEERPTEVVILRGNPSRLDPSA